MQAPLTFLQSSHNHPTYTDNFNSSCPIPCYIYYWINMPSTGDLILRLICLVYMLYLGKF